MHVNCKAIFVLHKAVIVLMWWILIAGHWSGDSESACRRDSWNTAASESENKTTHSDKDSAVSLLTNSCNEW